MVSSLFSMELGAFAMPSRKGEGGWCNLEWSFTHFHCCLSSIKYSNYACSECQNWGRQYCQGVLMITDGSKKVFGDGFDGDSDGRVEGLSLVETLRRQQKDQEIQS